MENSSRQMSWIWRQIGTISVRGRSNDSWERSLIIISSGANRPCLGRWPGNFVDQEVNLYWMKEVSNGWLQCSRKWVIFLIFIYHDSSLLGRSGASALKGKSWVTEFSVCRPTDFRRLFLLLSFQYLTNQTDSLRYTWRALFKSLHFKIWTYIKIVSLTFTILSFQIHYVELRSKKFQNIFF